MWAWVVSHARAVLDTARAIKCLKLTTLRCHPASTKVFRANVHADPLADQTGIAHLVSHPNALTEAIDLFERMGIRRELAEARTELARLAAQMAALGEG